MENNMSKDSAYWPILRNELKIKTGTKKSEWTS